MLTAIGAWFAKYFSTYILPAILGWVTRHIQEWVKDWRQTKNTDAVVKESKDAKTPEDKDKAAKDMADNY